MSDAKSSPLGRTIGSYRLEEEIGRGGMGVVYRALRVDNGETVAIKLMLPEIAANERFRTRFVREASLGSDLDHPNIVPIYDAGDANGELFIAMRLVEGRDLKEVLHDEGHLDPKRMLGILRQVASALDTAHELGVVHHDIKPQNVLVSERQDGDGDLVFVTDFGLLKPAGSESTNSRTGSHVFGSIQYMPPEQVEGLPADGRADVYALGCVIFECLTGQIPFDRPNEVAVLWAHVHEDPARVTDVRPGLPGGLDQVVATAMAKRPDDRYLTCGELTEAFESGLQRTSRPLVMPVVRPLVKRVPRRKTESEVWAPNYFPELSRVRKLTNKTNWVQVTAITSILCLLAAALVHFAHPRGIGGAVSDAALAVGGSVLSAGERVTSSFSDEEADTSRPDRDARSSAAPRRGEGKDVAGAGATRARRDGDDPAGAAASLSVKKQPIDNSGGEVGRAGEIVFDAPGPWWSGYSALYTMKANGRGVKLLYNSAEEDVEPAWSPDGGRVAFRRADSIYVINADGSGLRRLTFSGTDRDPAWSPDGRSILYSHATSGSDYDIYEIVVGDTVNVGQPLTTGPAWDRDPEWSPSGTSILFTRSEGGAHRLMTMNADGSALSALTPESVGAEHGEWSPDGARVVFVGGDGKMRLLRVDTSKVQKLGCPGRCSDPSFDPNGLTLVFGACRRLCEESTIFSAHLLRPDVIRKLEEKVSPGTEVDWR